MPWAIVSEQCTLGRSSVTRRSQERGQPKINPLKKKIATHSSVFPRKPKGHSQPGKYQHDTGNWAPRADSIPEAILENQKATTVIPVTYKVAGLNLKRYPSADVTRIQCFIQLLCAMSKSWTKANLRFLDQKWQNSILSFLETAHWNGLESGHHTFLAAIP